ncbi:hypothetical protein [Pseudarthrobacter sp. Y6]|uniref:hypothetical protein n=1 Tax=Pseudarthrobacter sp. Y6 TaxID=3418422 RepID=UPI003CE79A70
MNSTIAMPATVRELIGAAQERGVQPSELLPPAGYTLAEGCSDYYIGTETKNDAWVVAAGWDAQIAAHRIEVWTVKDRNLSPAEALEMAAALTAAAEAADA